MEIQRLYLSNQADFIGAFIMSLMDVFEGVLRFFFNLFYFIEDQRVQVC